MTRRPDRPSMQDVAEREAEQQAAQERLDRQVQGWTRDNELLDAKLAQYDERAAQDAPDPGPVAHSQSVRDFLARTREQAAREDREHRAQKLAEDKDPLPGQPDPFVDLMRERLEYKRARRRSVVSVVTRRGT
jgi:hypothetical protein